MTLSNDAFEYLAPSPEQLVELQQMRAVFSQFCTIIDQMLPEGPDKTFVLRQLRTASMWANVALTRNADGSPRS